MVQNNNWFSIFAILGLFILSIALPASSADKSFSIELDKASRKANSISRNLSVKAGNFTNDSDLYLDIDAWSGECRFRLNLHPLNIANYKSFDINLSNDTGQILDVSFGDTLSSRVFQRPDGNLEWTLDLNEKPTANIFNFRFECQNLNFVYQDTALVSDCLKTTSSFPDSTIYSWVAYHAHSKNNFHVNNQIYEYKTGQAFIIYRPKAFDANGRETWCHLDIDTTNSILSLTVPESFLDSAAYPVMVDPTIGNTTEGAWSAFPSNWLMQVPYFSHSAATDDGEITNGYVYAFTASNFYACSLRCFVYDYSTTLANCDLIDSSDIVDIDNLIIEWHEFAFSGASVSSGTEYIPAFVGYTEENSVLRVSYGIGGWGDNRNISQTDWTAPSTLSGANPSSEAWSCYFEYTVGASEAEFLKRRRQLLINSGEDK